MQFADLHMHALYGVDDGAKTKSDMFAMVDAAYAGGTRYLCVTPHFHPGYYKSSGEHTASAFKELQAYAAQRYADLHLALGNELHYSKDCISWLADGLCRTLNNTEYVLVDFNMAEEPRTITKGLHQLLNAGYTPVLAHAERYTKLHWALKEVKEYSAAGVLIQLDTQSLTGEFGLLARERSKAMIKLGLADFVSSDAHNGSTRPPQMAAAYACITQKFGTDTADALCFYHGRQLLWNTEGE